MEPLKPQSPDEDEELLSTDPESKDRSKDKKPPCKVKWSRDEDEKLKKQVEQHGPDSWKTIAQFFPGRTDGQCQHRWQKVLNPELVKGPWTKEEDQKVIDLVHKYGPKRWSVIAKHLQGRIGKQCRERWHNHLNPEVKKSSWTQEEDRIIYEAHQRLGNRWAEISKLLPGRTDNSIKNHWNSTMRRKVELEGYLQDGSRALSSSQGKRRPLRAPQQAEPPHCEQMGAFPYDAPQSRPLVDPLLDSFSSPNCLDDPDRETRIKELELLLMSAESEVQRQSRDPRALDHYSSWSDGLSDDTLEDQGVETRSWRGSDVSSGAPGLSSGHPPVSPSRFLSETSTVLSSLQNIPEFAETMELIDSMCFALQDPVSWSDVGSFDLSETETPPRHHQAGFSSLSFPSSLRERSCSSSSFGLTPISCSKPPLTGRRRRREKGELNPNSFLENISNSPRKTPTKSLPFTPSRFCNLSGAENLHLENPALTSTPVCSQRCLQNTPLHKETTPKHHKENEGSRTPKFRKTVMIQTPRTPTPFKNALAAQEKMHGPLKMEPQPLAFLEEDIREVLQQEAGSDIFNRADTQPEDRAWKHNIEGPARKVRKSLVLDPWGKDCLNVQLFQINSNQASDEGLLTGSSLIQDQECGRSLTESSLAPRRCSPRKNKLLSSHKAQKHSSLQVSEWEAVVYGKTEDQLMMTEAARQYLTSTSRTLVL